MMARARGGCGTRRPLWVVRISLKIALLILNIQMSFIDLLTVRLCKCR